MVTLPCLFVGLCHGSMCRVGQSRTYTPYMAVNSMDSLQKILYRFTNPRYGLFRPPPLSQPLCKAASFPTLSSNPWYDACKTE